MRTLLIVALATWPAFAQMADRYEPPPGDRFEHEAAGFARVMCNAVFLTGLDPDFAAENVGYFTAPYESRAKLGKPVIDRVARTVRVGREMAKDLGSQGCVNLPVHFKPLAVRKHVDTARPWPMGNAVSQDPVPAGLNAAKVKQAVDAAFAPDGMTAALVVVWKGHIVGERYATNIRPQAPLESWSMGKSVTATLLGILIRQGVYKLDQPAPIPEWQHPGDPRAKIRIEDLLHMSSGLRCRAPNDPDFDPGGPYPDHLYLYTTPGSAFEYAATRPVQWPPNTVGRYRNTDPVLVNYLVRLAVEKRDEEYLSFPQRALFDKLGIGTMVLETDSYGNFLAQGYDLASARDWARLGMLYLQDGVWNGERILPEGFVKFVQTLAPAWKAENRPIYGGFFWINGTGRFAVPKQAYSMMGAGGQFVTIIPSHDLVVVRLGYYKGAAAGEKALNRGFQLLMQAVPAHSTTARGVRARGMWRGPVQRRSYRSAADTPGMRGAGTARQHIALTDPRRPASDMPKMPQPNNNQERGSGAVCACCADVSPLSLPCIANAKEASCKTHGSSFRLYAMGPPHPVDISHTGRVPAQQLAEPVSYLTNVLLATTQ